MLLESTFAQHREMLWRLCYRMTGSAADAEDLVQQAFVRALEHPPSDLASELRPWLVHVALNLSRDLLRRRKRAAYLGPWLPSPLPTEPPLDTAAPDARYSELESVSCAFLVALEALSPSQRAVLLLRDVLGYSVEETAKALATNLSRIKTTHHRAREKLATYDSERVPLSPEHQARVQAALLKLLMAFFQGDVAALEAMLAEDVRALNDSNGEFVAARVPVEGRERVIRFHLNIQRERDGQVAWAVQNLNGLAAGVFSYAHAPSHMARQIVFQIALNREGLISEMNTVVASRKLSHVPFQQLIPA